MQLIRRRDLKPSPWKNGGGITWEIATSPEDATFETFDWRLSIAQVAAEGAFSVFAGVDRTLTLLEGEGMSLAFAAGAEVALTPGAAPFSFPGEAAINGLPRGVIHDFNVMSRRERLRHFVSILQSGERPAQDVQAVLCRAQAVTWAGHQLECGDLLLNQRGAGWPVAVKGLLAVSFTPLA